MYDFSGTGSDIGSWRDMSVGCGHSQCQLENDAAGGCSPTDNGGDGTCNEYTRPKKRLPFVSTRMQNSIVSYDNYLLVYSMPYMNTPGEYYSFNGIYYMNVEIEEWVFAGFTAEPCEHTPTITFYYHF